MKTMTKIVATVKRPPTMTVEELNKWWLGVHATMSKKLPGLKKYVISLAVGAPVGEPAFDGIAELWFDSMDDLFKARSSSAFEELRKDTTERRINITSIFTDEHNIPLP